MRKSLKTTLIVSSIILGMLILIYIQKSPLLAPFRFFEANVDDPPIMIACMTGGEPAPGEEVYANCVADNLAQLNADELGVDADRLRTELTYCAIKMGHKVPYGPPGEAGIPLNKLIDIMECKEDIIRKIENIDEELGDSKGPGLDPKISSNPFINNCPAKGQKVAVVFAGRGGSGHLALCTVIRCDKKTGETILNCDDSNLSPPPHNPPYNVQVSGDGTTVSVPPFDDRFNPVRAVGWIGIRSIRS